ncbi:MAG: tail fiber protein [Alphaproteobacteria bacterium]|nr:tail fiber protein [Alphaproteobacteria bacterium]
MLGEVTFFAGNFAVRGWAIADGSVLPISSNSALFSILGTTYGGDGKTTFALPDLRGRAAIGSGTGAGLTETRLGAKVGAEAATLATTESAARPRADERPGNGPPTKTAKPDQSIPLRDPSLALTPLICTSGTFPSRG